MIFLFLLLLIPNIASATTYYVRSDGGCPCDVGSCTGSATAGCSQICNGTTDAAYSVGASPNCALNHIQWVLPPRGTATNTLVTSGDTVVLGASKSADTFKVGCQNTTNCRDASVNMVNSTYCDGTYSNECQMSNGGTTITGVPDNITIVGCTASGCANNADRPILWASGRPDRVINLNTSDNVTLRDIEITDHVEGANGEDAVCNVAKTNDSGLDGIYSNSGSNITLDNVYIHGMCRYGMKLGGVNGLTMTDTVIHANGWSGWSIDSCSAAGTCGMTGTITLTNNTITYNGCVEEYPVSGSGENSLVAGKCKAQADGVIADGIESADMGGNWTLTGNNISWNTHDGPDLLYHNKGSYSGGTIVARRNRFEGNGGNAFKSSNSLILEDNLILGNCGYFTGNTITSATWSNVSDSCRAGGNTIEVSFKSDDVVPQIINNTILSNGDVGIDTAGTCTSGTDVIVVNNILLGGRQHNDDTYWNGAGGDDTSSIYFDSNVNCNADFVESYNICYNWKEGSSACNGTGSTDTINPLFFGDPIPMGPNSTVGYYGGVNLMSQVYLQSGSPAISAGTSSYGDSTDYNSYTQTSPYTQGALVYGSTPSGSTTVSKSSSTNGSIRLIGSVRFR